MDHRTRILAAVILTFVVTFSVGFVTENIRESMTFLWTIEEGQEFVFAVKVTGITTTNYSVSPPPFVEMNNTYIRVEILSLPNVTIIFYADTFLKNIVEPIKTSSSFSNGTDIPTEFRFIINRHISQCILPVGGWRHLDFFFPNQIDIPFVEHESYISKFYGNSFYFGYSINATNEAQDWYGIIDLETGVPHIVSFWFFRTSRVLTYWYNVTMNLVT
ncbi:MAG: hypothetical protein ACFFDQ_02165 [Candidatus Thorarchaeota archaeon]